MRIDNKLVPFKKKKLNIFIKEPFGTSKKLNCYYYKICFLLEEGTNKIVFKDSKNESIPATALAIQKYLEVSYSNRVKILWMMRHAGIILQIILFGKDVYYFNPNYAFCGDAIPEFLLKLFKFDGATLKGKHNISIKGTQYERTEAHEKSEIGRRIHSHSRLKEV